MSRFNNIYYNGVSYLPQYSDAEVNAQATAGNKLSFSTDGDFKNKALLLTTAEAMCMKDGISITFDLGGTFYHSDQFGDDGMINFAFFNNQINDISDYESYLPDDMDGCRFSELNDIGNGLTNKLFHVEDRDDYHDNCGFAIAFYNDTSDNSLDPVVNRFQLVIKRKEYEGLAEGHLVDTYSKTMCYDDTLPFSINLSRPCTLSATRDEGMMRIYLNGIWITEFYIGDDYKSASNFFNNDMYMSIFSVGTVTSASEITLHSVNGISAAIYFSEFREYVEILNKLISRENFDDLTEEEITKIKYLCDNHPDEEAYWQNEGLILKLLEWYEENKEVN